MKPQPDPVKLLLVAYEEADLFAAVHYQAQRIKDYPQVLAHNAASIQFRRKFRRSC